MTTTVKRRKILIESQSPVGSIDGPISPSITKSNLGMINLSKDLQAANSNVLCTRKQREFIPDNRKDDTYWDRRRKNNEAAKRSREKRRISDLMLETRVLELTRENALLLAELYAIKEAFRLPQSQHFINPDSITVQMPDLTCRQRRASVRSLVGAETTSEAGSTSSSVISTSSSTSSLLNSLSGPAAAVAACLAASCQQHQATATTTASMKIKTMTSNNQQSLSSSPPSQMSVQNHLNLHNNNNNQTPVAAHQNQPQPSPHLQHLSELMLNNHLNEHQFNHHHNDLLRNHGDPHHLRDNTANSSSCLPLKLRHKLKQNSTNSLYR